MKTISLAIAACISGLGPASAGVQTADFALPAVKASALRASDDAKSPAPSAPAAENKAVEYRTVRVCSYMFSYPQSGSDGVGIFAFDVDGSGRVCEIPFFQGQPYGGYRCDSGASTTASTDTGAAALLFRKRRADGSSLYHQLNVPADFAGLEKFRGKMRISGKPPKDLSKPLDGGGVHSLSCKMKSVAFGSD